MNFKETAEINAEFRIQDPIQVFDTFSQEEIERRHQSDAEFNAKLYQEARALVLFRLRANHAGQEESI